PSRCAFQRCSQGEDALKKLTAGFRNPLLLGLAIWFSKTEPLVLLRDFCYRTSCWFRFTQRGCSFYFSSQPASTSLLRPASKFVGAVQ
ncbi:hypothetical protein, partial [Corallococcus exercitus]|uniref:hypothetical protein n=1 Tax=Corallococcus exercitus TaxID=2316736 RepID=UPI001C0F53DD